MTKEVTVNLFDMEWDKNKTPSLSETLRKYAGLPLDQRWRNDLRIEEIEERTDNNRNVFLLDFCKKRQIGPGRLGHVAPITSIQLRAGEDFGEETSALYSPSKKWLLVLNNYAGVGPTRMSSYWNAINPGIQNFDYQANPKLDQNVIAQFKRMKKISKVSVTATVDALGAAQADTGMALAQATQAINARRIKIELMANEPYGRGGVLDFTKTRKFIRELRKNDDDQVSQLDVKGEIDGKDQMIDLLEHKIKKKYPVTELNVLHHRYTQDSRWNLLLRTYHYWHDHL